MTKTASAQCSDSLNVIGEPGRISWQASFPTRHAKQVADGIGAREMTDITMHSPSAVLMLAAKLFAQIGFKEERTPFFHFAMSNVPGPTMPMYLWGAKLQAWTVMVPLSHGFGLGFAVTSYLDRLSVSFTANRKAIPDPEFFERCIDRSFSAHLDAASMVLRKHSELLQHAGQAPPRANPGMVTMGRLGANGDAVKMVAPKAQKPARKATRAAQPAPAPRRSRDANKNQIRR